MVGSIVNTNVKRHDVHAWICAADKDADSRQRADLHFRQRGHPKPKIWLWSPGGARHHVGLADWVVTWHWLGLSLSGVEIIIIGASVYEKPTACSVRLCVRCCVLNVCRGRLSLSLSDIPDRRVYIWGCADGQPLTSRTHICASRGIWNRDPSVLQPAATGFICREC